MICIIVFYFHFEVFFNDFFFYFCSHQIIFLEIILLYHSMFVTLYSKKIVICHLWHTEVIIVYLVKNSSFNWWSNVNQHFWREKYIYIRIMRLILETITIYIMYLSSFILRQSTFEDVVILLFVEKKFLDFAEKNGHFLWLQGMLHPSGRFVFDTLLMIVLYVSNLLIINRF